MKHLEEAVLGSGELMPGDVGRGCHDNTIASFVGFAMKFAFQKNLASSMFPSSKDGGCLVPKQSLSLKNTCKIK